MWHSRPPRDPTPPFMANAILNFHFDYWHTSLISQYLSLPITIFTLSYLTGRVLWLGSTAQFWVYPPLQLPSPAGWLPQFSPWQWSVLATRWCGVYSQDERQVIFNSSNLPVSATALFIMTFFYFYISRDFIAVVDLDSITSKQHAMHQISSQSEALLIANGLTDLVRFWKIQQNAAISIIFSSHFVHFGELWSFSREGGYFFWKVYEFQSQFHLSKQYSFLTSGYHGKALCV